MGRTSTSTIANPEKIAPSTKNGANSVECHPGTSAIAKSQDTTLWTESTSGVASAAMSGTRPTMKNTVLIERYVEIANTSQTRGERKLGHSVRWFGYGSK